MAKKTQQTTSKAPTQVVEPSAPFNWLPWILAILAIILYATGFSNPLVAIDDHTATVDNVAVKSFNVFGHFNLGMYAPLTWMGYAIAYRLNGGAAAGENALWFHIFSAAVHAVNVVLVYRLFQKVSTNGFIAGMVALFFAVHPIQVESVSWVAAFSTPLYALFTLLSLNYYLRYTEEGKSRWYQLALLMAVLGCLAKSSAVVIPLLIVLLDYWKQPATDLKKRIAGYAPFFLISLVFGLLTIYSRQQTVAPPGVAADYSAFERFLAVCYTPLFYIGKLFYPLHLNVYYSFNRNAAGQLPLIYYISPLVVAGLAFAAWYLRKKAPYIAFGLLFFMANHLFTLPFAPVGSFELCSDHYNYIAAAGIFFILAAGLAKVMDQQPDYAAGIKALVGVWAIGLFVLSTRQIGVWKETMTLMDNSIANGYFSNGKIYYWRGMEFGDRGQKGDQQKALDDFNRAIEIDSTLYDCYKYRGTFQGMKGQFDKSVADLTKYLNYNPNDAEYRFNRGLSYMSLEKYNEAINDFNLTLQSNPQFWQVYDSRSTAYAILGDTTRALADRAEFEKRRASAGRKK